VEGGFASARRISEFGMSPAMIARSIGRRRMTRGRHVGLVSLTLVSSAVLLVLKATADVLSHRLLGRMDTLCHRLGRPPARQHGGREMTTRFSPQTIGSGFLCRPRLRKEATCDG
jgi:hypothetical protein